MTKQTSKNRTEETGLTSDSRVLSAVINRPPDEVYDYAVDPANLPEWAPGLGTSVEQIDGQWFVQTPTGQVGFAFTPWNTYGVLDHEVTLSSGEVLYNPMRVTRNGSGSEVIFSLRRSPGMTDEEFDRDAGLVAADLARLKACVEAR
jgi:hypothetical protein